MNEVMVFIAYDRAIDEELSDLLEEIDAQYYTKWKDVLGIGRHDPHLGDDVWPGLNNVIMAVVEEDKKERMFDRVKALQASFASVGLRAFAVPVIGMI